MTTLVIPDYKQAFLTYVRTLTDVTAICTAARVRGDMPGYYITCVKQGGPGVQARVHRRARLDVWVYGKTPYNAMLLWRTLEGALCAPDTARGFTAAGCRVLDIYAESEPFEAVTNEGWPYLWVPYLLRYAEHPVTP
jgi:hypothetical protein